MTERIEDILSALVRLNVTSDSLFDRIRSDLDRGLVREARSHLNFVDRLIACLLQLMWIPVERELPPLDVPVWLYLPDVRQHVIGCRSDGGEGWLWGRCYSDFWYDPDMGEWKTETCDTDDYAPSHWMSLPVPPRHKTK